MTDLAKWNPADTPSFSREEMACKCGHCDGRADMDADFMAKLQAMRDRSGPLAVTSGFRCPQHPEERKKSSPGSHAQGKAADLSVLAGAKRYVILNLAFEVGMRGVGIGETFIHLDSGHDHAPRPAVWRYP